MSDQSTDADFDKAAFVRALREYHAAENSYRRAHAELTAAFKEGLVVLHKCPGEKTDLYWSYWPPTKNTGWSTGVNKGSDDLGIQTVIIEAPKPREEFLPRLPQ